MASGREDYLFPGRYDPVEEKRQNGPHPGRDASPGGTPGSVLLALDPGKSSKGGLGWSVWHGPEFLAAGLARVKGHPELGARALLLADQVPHGAEDVVVERMVQYPGWGRSDSPQARDRKANDLLDLQAIGGIVAGHCVAKGGRIHYVTPHGWKGELPKEVAVARVRKYLHPSELAVLERCLAEVPAGLHHNVYESIGIGLWFLRRWKR